MKIIQVEGFLDTPGFEKLCLDHQLDPKKVVFLFPGNASHHEEGTTLFSVKSGGGLAHLARTNGQKGYPVLSLPTTTMEEWENNDWQKEIVTGAIADLYRALGAGYYFMLPVRDHASTYYFSEGLKSSAGKKEPSFWGGIQRASNIALADHYQNELDYFQEFVTLTLDDQLALTNADRSNPYCAAFLHGHSMTVEDAWLQADSVEMDASSYRR